MPRPSHCAATGKGDCSREGPRALAKFREWPVYPWVMPPSQTPEALLSSDHELRLIVDTIPGLVAVMTARGEVDLVNQQVLDCFGRSLDGLKQWGTSDAVHPDDLPSVIAAWARAVETGAPYEFER